MEFNSEIIEHYNRGSEEKRLKGISLEKIRTQEIIYCFVRLIGRGTSIENSSIV